MMRTFVPKTAFLLFLFSASLQARATDVELPTLQAGDSKIEVQKDLSLKLTGSKQELRFDSAALRVFSPKVKMTPVQLTSVVEKTPGEFVITGRNQWLEQTLTLKSVKNTFVIGVTYKNISDSKLMASGWSVLKGQMNTGKQEMWSFQPGSYTERPNWLQPVKAGFSKKNFMGMNATDYGGGTPFVALWTRDSGVSVASLAREPQLISFPVSRDATKTSVGVNSEKNFELEAQAQIDLGNFTVSQFKGDYFSNLKNYAVMMKELHGLKEPASPKDIGPIWCAWGYGRDFTVEQVIQSLSVAKELGFEWVGIDDGWQEAIGDWTPNLKKFPNGEKDLKRLVEAIHAQGMKAQLWWAPLAAHQKSKAIATKPDEMLLNENQKPRDITWWDAWYLCPAVKTVREDIAGLTQKFIKDWGFDGLKIDGQHLNATPECFNPKHNHKSAGDSFVMHSQVFKEILQAAQTAKAGSLVEVCPCGANMSIYNLPFQNMTVSADPEKSVQVRQKGKTLKALTGDSTVFFGDHVELSDKGIDFQSTLAVGGLPGSNFTLKHLTNVKPPPGDPPTVLTDLRRAEFKKWITIAKDTKPWTGQYRGELYDIAFDKPETHVVQNQERLSFGFFAKKFSGSIELRGLQTNTEYELKDLTHGKVMARVQGPVAQVKVSFEHSLMLQADPVVTKP